MLALIPLRKDDVDSDVDDCCCCSRQEEGVCQFIFPIAPSDDDPLHIPHSHLENPSFSSRYYSVDDPSSQTLCKSHFHQLPPHAGPAPLSPVPSTTLKPIKLTIQKVLQKANTLGTICPNAAEYICSKRWERLCQTLIIGRGENKYLLRFLLHPQCSIEGS